MQQAGTFITRKYGRKQGIVRHGWQQLRLMFGSFRHLENIEWSRVNRLVFVCAGNICRSPYSEACARAAGLRCSSFGLRTGGGDAADPHALRAAARQRVDMTAHRSRSAAEFRIESDDLVLGMEPWHAEEIMELPGDGQTSLCGLLCRPRRPHIEDPFGLSDDWFDTCFRLLGESVQRVAEKLA